MNCINPIYKLVEYLNTQVTSTTSDADFRDLLIATLNTNVNGYSIPKRLNPTLCCPECPTEDCNGGTHFLGNVVNFISFNSAYIIDDENDKLPNRVCCANFICAYETAIQEGTSGLAALPLCCNSFSKGNVDNLLLSMETWYNMDNSIHNTMCADYPHNIIISNGIVEYSLFNGDSAIYDFMTATNLLPTDSFKFIFLMYILNEGLVTTCSECAQANNTINIMTTSNFIINCLGN